MKHNHLNYIILSDGDNKFLFERLGKNVSFDAYNPAHALCSGVSVDDILQHSPIPIWQIEKSPYEVIFNE